MTEPHVIKLMDRQIPEHVVPAHNSRYYAIKEVRNLGDIFDVINKSSHLKVVP